MIRRLTNFAFVSLTILLLQGCDNAERESNFVYFDCEAVLNAMNPNPRVRIPDIYLVLAKSSRSWDEKSVGRVLNKDWGTSLEDAQISFYTVNWGDELVTFQQLSWLGMRSLGLKMTDKLMVELGANSYDAEYYDWIPDAVEDLSEWTLNRVDGSLRSQTGGSETISSDKFNKKDWSCSKVDDQVGFAFVQDWDSNYDRIKFELESQKEALEKEEKKKLEAKRKF